MELLLEMLILIPVLGFFISLLVPGNKEKLISGVILFTTATHVIAFISLAALWLMNGRPNVNIKELALYKAPGYEFYIDFYFDRITAVYLFVGSFITLLITIYSRYYMHRETGYKRFFNTMLFFYMGYNMAVLSGNLETLFVGWEILGVSSFLLIAFYRNRYLPVKNAVKVFSIYRIGDVGLILAMWMSHHLWHDNISFLKLNNFVLVHDQLLHHSLIGVFISLMILLSASAKSALLPFSSWLPRAMEGPTPSSAIFYGSLSVHLGVFLMLRTYPFWEHQHSVRIFIALLGMATSIVTIGIARAQSSVKSQVAYSSISQIGIIFIEIALGFENLALFHFAANAFLRTYQLLVSPSVVSYLIREQFYNFKPHKDRFEGLISKKIRYTFYTLSLQEWNLDSFMYRFLWNPVKTAGTALNFLNARLLLATSIPLYLLGLYCVYNKQVVPATMLQYLPYLFMAIGVLLVLKSFVKRKSVMLSWILILMSHFWVALAVAFNEQFRFTQIHMYLSGIVVLGTMGILVLRYLKKIETAVDLDRFHGHAYKHPGIAIAFLIACLGASGFPISPTFIGEDLIFTHIHEGQGLLAFMAALIFILDGLSLIRIYARVFLGPHVHSPYDMAYRSS
jgi:NADH-quinone oxidoreductase subunit L